MRRERRKKGQGLTARELRQMGANPNLVRRVGRSPPTNKTSEASRRGRLPGTWEPPRRAMALLGLSPASCGRLLGLLLGRGRLLGRVVGSPTGSTAVLVRWGMGVNAF
jgi:hypothetical protein